MTLDSTSSCAPVTTRIWYPQKSTVHLVATGSTMNHNCRPTTDPPTVEPSLLLHDSPSPTQLSRTRTGERSYCYSDHGRTVVFRCG